MVAQGTFAFVGAARAKTLLAPPPGIEGFPRLLKREQRVTVRGPEQEALLLLVVGCSDGSRHGLVLALSAGDESRKQLPSSKAIAQDVTLR